MGARAACWGDRAPLAATFALSDTRRASLQGDVTVSGFPKPSINWLFAFIPVTVILDRWSGASPTLVFFSAALSIIPIAHLIAQSTEQLAIRTGDTIGGLLNATFGNFPELIIAMAALRGGLLDMVRASLIGAILANLLLAMGLSFFLGGLRFRNQEYNPTSARLYSSMMLIAVISLAVPSAFQTFLSSTTTVPAASHLNIGLAVVLLAAYALFLLFTVKTHPDLFKSTGTKGGGGHPEKAEWSMPRAVATLIAASLLAAWMSEILVGKAEATGRALGMTDTFIGIVFLAVIGGAAEMGSAIAMARKDKMDLSIGIALGSCIQIALFIAPVLVFVSYLVAPAPLLLTFGRQEIGALFLTVLLGAIVVGDGRSNWYKGVQLVTVYTMIALLFFFIPEVAK